MNRVFFRRFTNDRSSVPIKCSIQVQNSLKHIFQNTLVFSTHSCTVVHRRYCFSDNRFIPGQESTYLCGCICVLYRVISNRISSSYSRIWTGCAENIVKTYQHWIVKHKDHIYTVHTRKLWSWQYRHIVAILSHIFTNMDRICLQNRYI